MCTRCVMDTSDKAITFDTNGVCNHCHSYDEAKKTWDIDKHVADNSLAKLFSRIRDSRGNKTYDSIIGLSGGVDSSYVAFLAKRHGLKPLCVHLDNGWNSELATDNIHHIVVECGFDLYTHVIDWNEFRDLQRAFFKAGVIDLEVLSDHAIFGIIVQLARKNGIKHILSGANISTEHVMPKSWVHRKQDLTNIRGINRKFGESKLRTFPQVSTLRHVAFMYVLGHKVYKPLNLIHFNKQAAKAELKEHLGWRDYGGKHYESIFTKFYQAHILPEKFKVDKRRAHLSSLVLSEQMTREDALAELEKPIYPPQDLENDREYVLKKLGFTREWFDNYLREPGVPHKTYGSDQLVYNLLSWAQKRFVPNA
jgi:N-acetyl sugar amidotransferase